jgi:hypothetical protein
LWGFTFQFAGAIGFLQYAFVAGTYAWLDGNFVPVNILQIVTFVVGFAFPLFLWKKQKLKKDNAVKS